MSKHIYNYLFIDSVLAISFHPIFPSVASHQIVNYFCCFAGGRKWLMRFVEEAQIIVDKVKCVSL